MATTNSRTFERVGRVPRLSDTITEQVLDAIVAGHFEVGEILPSERELGEQFGVSRTVIREAVRALAARGVVDVQTGRGARVVGPDVRPVTAAMSLLFRSGDIDFPKLHEVRTMIEQCAAGLAAERGTAENLAELDRLHDQLTVAEQSHDVEAASRLDMEFHRAIATSTGNELFHVLLDSISPALKENRRATMALPHKPERVLADHRRIIDAIRAKDAPGARQAMSEHLAGVAQAWTEAMALSVGVSGVDSELLGGDVP